MRKFYIIFIFLIVPLSFSVVKVLGQERKDQIIAQTAEVRSKVVAQIAEGEAVQNDNLPEVISQPSTSTSSEVIDANSCNLNLSANLAIARFLDQDSNVFSYNATNHWPIASVTKLMTAVVAVENISDSRTIAMKSSMLEVEGSAGDFKPGEVFKLNDLIKAMLIVSSNDASEAIAQDYGRDKFLELMNQKAYDLGMNQSTYNDPTGLSSVNQSTPNDIFKLLSYIYKNHPDILKITATPKDTITELNSYKRRKLLNINQFAGQRDFIGGKTGFTDEAQGNLVTIFNVKDRLVAIEVFGSQDRFGETTKLLNCIK